MRQTQTALIPTLLEAIESDLRKSFDPLSNELPEGMKEMFDYHFGWGSNDQVNRGKRIRPLLTLLSCGAAGGDWQQALPLASGIEMVHNFSLIHDDIEDQSETRRGKMTVWKKWGVPRAINIGDAMFVIARASIQRLSDLQLPSPIIFEVEAIIDWACLRLTIGQDLDLFFETETQVSVDKYLQMISGKTSALIAAATSSGAVLAETDAQHVDSFRQFGHHLGLAFQIRDDILGIWGEPEKTGKSAEDDLRMRKKTLPIIFGLNRSPEFARLWELGKTDVSSLQSMRQLLHEAQALQDAETLSGEHSRKALEALDALETTNEYLQELKDLARNLLNRQN